MNIQVCFVRKRFAAQVTKSRFLALKNKFIQTSKLSLNLIISGNYFFQSFFTKFEINFIKRKFHGNEKSIHSIGIQFN